MHTQGKLRVTGHIKDTNRQYIRIVSADGEMIADVRHVTWDGDDTGPEDAARLVKCWNSHDELVAALRAIMYPNNGRTIDFDSKREYYRAFIEGGELDNARALLDKLEGK